LRCEIQHTIRKRARGRRDGLNIVACRVTKGPKRVRGYRLTFTIGQTRVMIGTFDTTIIVVEGVEGVSLTIVGMGVEGVSLTIVGMGVEGLLVYF
jgi:hypothetical protein